MTTAQPSNYHTVTPYLLVSAIEPQIDFLKAALGAETSEAIKGSDDQLVHAEVRIGDSTVMIGRAQGEQAPLPCMLYVYVKDVDASYHKALAAGARSVKEPTDAFYGDRSAGVADLHDNQWWIASQVEKLDNQELQRRALESGA